MYLSLLRLNFDRNERSRYCKLLQLVVQFHNAFKDDSYVYVAMDFSEYWWLERIFRVIAVMEEMVVCVGELQLRLVGLAVAVNITWLEGTRAAELGYILEIILVAHMKIQDDQESSLILFITKMLVFFFMMKTYTGLNVFSFVLYHLQTSSPTHLSIQKEAHDVFSQNFLVNTMPWMDFELSMVWSARYLAGYHQLNMSRAMVLNLYGFSSRCINFFLIFGRFELKKEGFGSESFN
ncbi:hypothetical protein MKW92_028663 [Papaver armeniacum]|nr:hypothetical protein MKW92_028663 [Papaver armeniacum]